MRSSNSLVRSTGIGASPERVPLRVVSGNTGQIVEGSDRRGQKISSACRLCLQVKPLQLSHIEPRWSSRWMKDEGVPLTRIPELDLVVASQDTSKHYLLCSICEQWLGEAENYLALIARGVGDEMAARGVVLHEGPSLSGLNPKLVRRAILGILFKGHFAQSPPWTSLSLDSKLVQSLRIRLLSDNYDSTSHPTIATKWMACHIEGANPRAFALPFWGVRPEVITFELTMGGWSWMVFMRGWTKAQREIPIDERFNLGNGRWRVLMGDFTQCRHISGNGVGAVELGQPRDYFPVDSPCPCGLGNGNFRGCCRDTWCAML